MDHADAFLESILEAPGDDAPRLIFADWLEDNGQLDRAEFIRLQIARTQLHPADPRTRASLRRERELLLQHEPAWVGPLAALASRCRFHRGFVEEVTIGVPKFLAVGDELFRRAPVRRLQLRETAALPALISSNPATAGRLAELLAPVRVLDLNREYLSEFAGLALLQLPTLPRLDALHLSHNALTPTGLGMLADSPALASLTTLEFNSASTAREPLDLLLLSPHLARLEHLSLATTRPGDRVVGLLDSKRFPRLRSLSLGHSNLSPDGLGQLVQTVSPTLETLDISFNPLQAEGLRYLTRSLRLDRLRAVNLSRTGLGEPGARVLAESRMMGQLYGLDLSLNRVNSKGATYLAETSAQASPGTLDLIYNPVGAAARDALAERFGDDVCLFRR